MLGIIRDLIKHLSDNDINYCHWKSNYRLDEFLDGKGDLDLLVCRKDANKFEGILSMLGFKESLIINTGIKHFYGLDNETGKIVHLHVYYQIKTGTDFLKPYRLQIEEILLKHIVRHKSGLIYLKKEIELVLFIFRLALKFSRFSYFLFFLTERHELKRELSYLINDVDVPTINQILEEIALIKEIDFWSLVESLKNFDLISMFKISNKIAKELSSFRYVNVYIEEIKNIFLTGKKVFQKLRILKKSKKKLANGGIFIAITGLDATGKTSITRDLFSWLDNHFEVSLMHFGKPPPTLLTIPFRLIIKGLRLKKKKNGGVIKGFSWEKKNDSFIYILRYLILAYERYSLVKKAWKTINEGGIVIFDRYKSENLGLMDSKRLMSGKFKGIKKMMALMENNFYNKMPIPDLIIHLTVPLEVALERNKLRKESDNECFLKERYAINKNLRFRAKKLEIIDTNSDYQLVLKQIKKIIWSIL